MNGQCLGLAHIGVMTNDLEESLAFYEKLGGVVRDRGVVALPEGEKHLVLVDVHGVIVELIKNPRPMELSEGVVSHFALLVEDIDKAHDALAAQGLDTFLTPRKKEGSSFGGAPNWFFTGPSGERIELMGRV